MTQRAVKVAGVVARAIVATELVLDVKLSVLAVLLGFVVLFAVLHEPAPALHRRVLTIPFHLVLARFLVLAFVQLLEKTRVGLLAVLTLRVGLRAFLRGSGRVLRIAHVLLPLGFRLVLVIILPIPHRSILPVSLPLLRQLFSGQWTCRAQTSVRTANCSAGVKKRRRYHSTIAVDVIATAPASMKA